LPPEKAELPVRGGRKAADQAQLWRDAEGQA